MTSTITWDERRHEQLRVLWGTELTAKEIAEQLGGFGLYAGKGRSAVLGQVKKLRDKAKEEMNDVEMKFWSREKALSSSPRQKRSSLRGSGARSGSRNSAGKTGKKRLNPGCEEPLPRDKVAEFIDSVPSIAVTWPTDAEVTAAWMRSVLASANENR